MESLIVVLIFALLPWFVKKLADLMRKDRRRVRFFDSQEEMDKFMERWQ